MSEYPFVTADISFIPVGVRNPESRYLSDTGEAVRNFEVEDRSVRIADGRRLQGDLSLDVQGFQFLTDRPTALGPVTEDTDPDIEALYHPEAEAILRAETGAAEVLIFDHTLRITGNEKGRQPVRSAHNDYTDRSAPVRLRQLLGQVEAARWLSGRVAQVNLWRPLVGPVSSLPLALLDARTVGPADLRRSALIFPDRRGETYGLSHSDAQRWTYFPDMTPDEAILIKGYDSAEDGRARFTPHTAFVLPGTPEIVPPRHSIELRAFLRFDP